MNLLLQIDLGADVTLSISEDPRLISDGKQAVKNPYYCYSINLRIKDTNANLYTGYPTNDLTASIKKMEECDCLITAFKDHLLMRDQVFETLQIVKILQRRLK